MKKRFIYIIMGVVLLGAGLFLTGPVHADSVKDSAINQLQAGAQQAGYGKEAQDPRIVAARMIQMFMSVIGVVVTALFIFAGYHFVTSHGVEEKISKARKTMQGAVIGLIIMLLAFSISYFLGRQTQEITGIGQQGPPMQYNP